MGDITTYERISWDEDSDEYREMTTFLDRLKSQSLTISLTPNEEYLYQEQHPPMLLSMRSRRHDEKSLDASIQTISVEHTLSIHPEFQEELRSNGFKEV